MGPKPVPLEIRFWSYVEQGQPNNKCWEWLGSKDRVGYGIIWERLGVGHKVIRRAHRVSWLISRGSLADDMHVLHVCDNPSCVNPDHLFLGRSRDNTNDMIRKGRGRNQYQDAK